MIFSKQATASDDAIRSLVISYKLLGTREWFVIHHTDCGMLLFTNDDMRSLLASSLKTATLDQNGWRDSGEGPGSTEGSYMGRDEVSTSLDRHRLSSRSAP
jgi:carbonic anhydrase